MTIFAGGGKLCGQHGRHRRRPAQVLQASPGHGAAQRRSDDADGAVGAGRRVRRTQIRVSRGQRSGRDSAQTDQESGRRIRHRIRQTLAWTVGQHNQGGKVHHFCIFIISLVLIIN